MPGVVTPKPQDHAEFQAKAIEINRHGQSLKTVNISSSSFPFQTS